VRAAWISIAALVAMGCGSEVNLNAVPLAVAGCEAPTEELLVPQAPMLPGRACITCHAVGGQAEALPWTAAGTVYDSPSSPCNTGGVANAKVEIADETRKILITLYTNRTGNFFTSEPLKYNKLIVRVSKDGKVREMASALPSSANCALCHYSGGPAGSRVYLN
jgi:hypothetical protein